MITDSYKHKGMRKSLVKTIHQKGIYDEKVLDAINHVPRHVFFDNAFLEHAYQDKAFPIGEGQTISQPYTVAFQTQLLEISHGDKVLEIGTGSGYQTCILLELGAKVYSIEYHEALHQKAKQYLNLMGYKPNLYCGDGSLGMKKLAPYDKIIVTAGAPTVPTSLIDQLKEGGILVIPVGNRENQKMIKIKKMSENKLIKKVYDNFSFVPLVGKDGWA